MKQPVVVIGIGEMGVYLPAVSYVPITRYTRFRVKPTSTTLPRLFPIRYWCWWRWGRTIYTRF